MKPIPKPIKRKKGEDINKQLDDAWSVAVKSLAGWRCQVCGKRNNLNSHHIVGRRNYRLRWEVRNGVCLCVSHHKFGVESAHENPVWFDKWLRDNRPSDYEFLQDPQNRDIRKWGVNEKQDLLRDLEKILKP